MEDNADDQPFDNNDFSSDSSPAFDLGPDSSLWDDDNALEALKLERTVHGDETNEQLVKRMLDEAAPRAVQSIMKIAFFGANENTKLNAAKYIVDRVLDTQDGAHKAKWEEMVGDMVSEAELLANAETE